jgi:hypothetical protein
VLLLFCELKVTILLIYVKTALVPLDVFDVRTALVPLDVLT